MSISSSVTIGTTICRARRSSKEKKKKNTQPAPVILDSKLSFISKDLPPLPDIQHPHLAAAATDHSSAEFHTLELLGDRLFEVAAVKSLWNRCSSVKTLDQGRQKLTTNQAFSEIAKAYSLHVKLPVDSASSPEPGTKKMGDALEAWMGAAYLDACRRGNEREVLMWGADILNVDRWTGMRDYVEGLEKAYGRPQRYPIYPEGGIWAPTEVKEPTDGNIQDSERETRFTSQQGCQDFRHIKQSLLCLLPSHGKPVIAPTPRTPPVTLSSLLRASGLRQEKLCPTPDEMGDEDASMSSSSRIINLGASSEFEPANPSHSRSSTIPNWTNASSRHDLETQTITAINVLSAVKNLEDGINAIEHTIKHNTLSPLRSESSQQNKPSPTSSPSKSSKSTGRVPESLPVPKSRKIGPVPSSWGSIIVPSKWVRPSVPVNLSRLAPLPGAFRSELNDLHSLASNKYNRRSIDGMNYLKCGMRNEFRPLCKYEQTVDYLIAMYITTAVWSYLAKLYDLMPSKLNPHHPGQKPTATLILGVIGTLADSECPETKAWLNSLVSGRVWANASILAKKFEDSTEYLKAGGIKIQHEAPKSKDSIIKVHDDSLPGKTKPGVTSQNHEQVSIEKKSHPLPLPLRETWKTARLLFVPENLPPLYQIPTIVLDAGFVDATRKDTRENASRLYFRLYETTVERLGRYSTQPEALKAGANLLLSDRTMSHLALQYGLLQDSVGELSQGEYARCFRRYLALLLTEESDEKASSEVFEWMGSLFRLEVWPRLDHVIKSAEGKQTINAVKVALTDAPATKARENRPSSTALLSNSSESATSADSEEQGCSEKNTLTSAEIEKDTVRFDPSQLPPPLSEIHSKPQDLHVVLGPKCRKLIETDYISTLKFLKQYNKLHGIEGQVLSPAIGYLCSTATSAILAGVYGFDKHDGKPLSAAKSARMFRRYVTILLEKAKAGQHSDTIRNWLHKVYSPEVWVYIKNIVNEANRKRSCKSQPLQQISKVAQPGQVEVAHVKGPSP
ncbi:uncharacterized protein I206_106070 [Kwoniella pini CBS 10737]|uniref:RNase III domain-containing protein n=1 Tax=Kwoniella pini CBS 10737 TaxID=1296096 RepID=A0A1B9I114_9TREE|nr:uncharacterized protein I206_04893 [Kwoniella pini CBS 10737]OCF49205.1 hypothetical protein I206_04893 [Kwoniella pini CBS 10737]